MNFKSLKQYKDMPENAKEVYNNVFESCKVSGMSPTQSHAKAYELAKTIWQPQHPRKVKP